MDPGRGTPPSPSEQSIEPNSGASNTSHAMERHKINVHTYKIVLLNERNCHKYTTLHGKMSGHAKA